MSTQTVNITIDEKLLREIDQAVKHDLESRSEYLRLAIIDLDIRKRWNDIYLLEMYQYYKASRIFKYRQWLFSINMSLYNLLNLYKYET